MIWYCVTFTMTPDDEDLYCEYVRALNEREAENDVYFLLWEETGYEIEIIAVEPA